MSRVWVTLKRSLRLIKFLLFCVILTFFIFMLWRIFSTGIPKELKPLTPNEKLCAAYAEKGEDLYVFNQRYDEITRADYNSGYFAVPEAVFIPEANQAQIVFRYNNSTITALAEDYSLESVPDREQELFDVSMVLYIDLTPDDDSDNEDVDSEGLKAVRITPSDSICQRTGLYNFYRYTFDFDTADEDIKQLIDDGTLIAVHVQFYYKEDLNYEERPYGAINVYSYQRKNSEVKISSKDKKALEQNS